MASCPPNFDPTKPPPEPPLPALRFLGKNCLTPVKKPIPASEVCSVCRCESYTFSLPWEQFKAEAKPAPGSNLYWRKRVSADVRDPVIARAFQFAAAISKRHFAYYFGPGREHGGMKMSEVLERYKKELKVNFGAVTVEIKPKPSETAAQFVKRGGYLLWTDGWNGGVFGHKDGRPGTFLDSKRPEWLAQSGLAEDISSFQLYLDDYDIPTNRITLVVRLKYQDTTLSVILGKITDAGVWALKQSCKLISNEKVNQAMAFASVYYGTPQAAALTVWWKKAGEGCGFAFDPKPCTPVGAAPGTTPMAPTYPAGSMTWFDTSASIYRVATPNGSPTAPTHVEIAQVASAPVGVPVVSRSTWERATRAWYARRTTHIATGIGLFAAIGAGAVAVVARR